MKNLVSELDWSKGLLPAVIQDEKTLQIRMLGYMNQAALEKTLETNQVCFFSRSKQRLWTKGESSGNFLTVKDIRIDCDQDSILIQVDANGPTCHLGSDSCFDPANRHILDELEALIDQRVKDGQKDSSYTARMMAKGTRKLAQKVGEEGVEVALAAVAQSDQELLEESADLLFHLLLTLRSRGLSIQGAFEVLKSRRN